jgi:hypothetical protein
MRKLRLFPERLEVESFATTPRSAPPRGTVHANMPAGGPLVDDPVSSACEGGGDGTACGVCVGPSYCCPETWNCPVINTNTASQVVSAMAHPCTC